MTEVYSGFQRKETQVDTQLDAIIVLGKNIGVDWTRETVRNQRFHLSPHSRINVLAAGILYKSGFTNKLIFSTGKTAGSDLPSEAQAMKDHLKRIFPSIPDEAIMLEQNSLNTDTNAKEVKKIVDKNDFKNVGLLTTGFHLPRANMLFGLHGFHLTQFASEEVLASKRAKFVENYLQEPLVQREVKKEAMALRIQTNALGRFILSSLTRITRGR